MESAVATAVSAAPISLAMAPARSLSFSWAALREAIAADAVSGELITGGRVAASTVPSSATVKPSRLGGGDHVQQAGRASPMSVAPFLQRGAREVEGVGELGAGLRLLGRAVGGRGRPGPAGTGRTRSRGIGRRHGPGGRWPRRPRPRPATPRRARWAAKTGPGRCSARSSRPAESWTRPRRRCRRSPARSPGPRRPGCAGPRRTPVRRRRDGSRPTGTPAWSRDPGSAPDTSLNGPATSMSASAPAAASTSPAAPVRPPESAISMRAFYPARVAADTGKCGRITSGVTAPRRQTTSDWPGRRLAEHRQLVDRLRRVAAPSGDAPGAAPRGSPRARRAAPSLRDARACDLVLEVEQPADALDADAGRGQLGDRAEQLDVAVGVAPPAAAGATRGDQAHPLVGAQRLRVQPGQLGSDADDVDRGVGAGCVERAARGGVHDALSNRLARSGLPAVASR